MFGALTPQRPRPPHKRSRSHAPSHSQSRHGSAELSMSMRPRQTACGPASPTPTTTASLALEEAGHREDDTGLLRRIASICEEHLEEAPAAVSSARHPRCRSRRAAPPRRAYRRSKKRRQLVLLVELAAARTRDSTPFETDSAILGCEGHAARKPAL